MNRRKLLVFWLCVIALCLAFVMIAGWMLRDAALVTDFTRKDLPPSALYPFGTDWMGRDMLARTLCGLSLSLRIGLLAAACSAVLALALGTLSGMFGGLLDRCTSFLTDLLMGIPHLLLVLLISFAAGRGTRGVILGIVLTHWMSLARLMRAEVRGLRGSIYIQAALRLGVPRGRVVLRHMLPHLLPQFLTGLLLMLPHAILHEASVTFLGFGLPAEMPAIGIILSESTRYLVLGQWWLAVLPGLMLALVVMLFQGAAGLLRALLDPATAHH